jgi:pre-mRNA-splicing factor RBM22/SLT11
MDASDAFPIVCEKCLGPNPYLRMTKVPLGASCRISGTPFTVHKWKVPGGRQRETIIAQEVAVTKNVCQCCLNDLEYGLPSHLVDSLATAIHGAERLPGSDANREFFWDEKRRAVADGREDGSESYGKLRGHAHKLERLAAMAPYVNPHKHGPGQVPEPRQQRAAALPAAQPRRDLPPRDLSVKAVFVAGIPPGVGERELVTCCAPYGRIASIKLNMERFCAHVEFHERASALACIEGLRDNDNLVIQGTRLRVMWARSSGDGRSHPPASTPAGLPPGIRASASQPAASLPPGIRIAIGGAGQAGAGPDGGRPSYPSTSASALESAGARVEL